MEEEDEEGIGMRMKMRKVPEKGGGKDEEGEGGRR